MIYVGTATVIILGFVYFIKRKIDKAIGSIDFDLKDLKL